MLFESEDSRSELLFNIRSNRTVYVDSSVEINAEGCWRTKPEATSTEQLLNMRASLLCTFTLFWLLQAASSQSNDCFHSHDGYCDVPDYCYAGTDCTDCGTCGPAPSSRRRAPCCQCSAYSGEQCMRNCCRDATFSNNSGDEDIWTSEVRALPSLIIQMCFCCP